METKVTCPTCRTEFALESTHLTAQFEAAIKKDLSVEIQRREQELADQRQEFLSLSNEFKQEKEDFTKLIDEKVKSEIKSKEEVLKDSIRKQVQEEKQLQLTELETELQRKTSQLIEMNQTKAKLQQLSREMEEKESQIHLKMEEELTRRLSEMKNSTKKQVELEAEFKIREKQMIIDSLKKKLDEASRRIDQGSMQSQGEVMELSIEELLKDLFPNDLVEEVKKGLPGFDSTQTVQIAGKKIGTIGYESKNTKAWSDSFIQKIKTDNLRLRAKCDLLIIVCKVLPKEMEDQRFKLIDGVWVTNMHNLEDLATLLRFGIIKVHEQRQLHQNGDSKAHLLYQFLTSEECNALFNSMMDGLKNLEEMNLEEERKLQVLFKKRQKQLQQILSNLISYYGIMKGISTDSIQDIDFLEFKEAS